MENTNNTARKVARQTWGHVQHQRKLADGIWLFHTESHGGIVTDFNVRPETEFMERFVYTRAGSRDGLCREQHYAAFEEDCDACMVEWLYASEIMTKKYMHYFVGTEETSLREWKNERLSIIRNSLVQWNPGFLEKYPEPDMGTYVLCNSLQRR